MITTIEVFCDDPFHDGKQESVHRFISNSDRLGGQWFSEADPRSGAQSSRRGSGSRLRLRGEKAAMQELQGDRYLTTELWAEVFSEPIRRAPTRLRFNLECDCGVTVPARSENLYPIFDMLVEAGLVEAGIARISLRALAARLRH